MHLQFPWWEAETGRCPGLDGHPASGLWFQAMWKPVSKPKVDTIWGMPPALNPLPDLQRCGTAGSAFWGTAKLFPSTLCSQQWCAHNTIISALWTWIWQGWHILSKWLQRVKAAVKPCACLTSSTETLSPHWWVKFSGLQPPLEKRKVHPDVYPDVEYKLWENPNFRYQLLHNYVNTNIFYVTHVHTLYFDTLLTLAYKWSCTYKFTHTHIYIYIQTHAHEHNFFRDRPNVHISDSHWAQMKTTHRTFQFAVFQTANTQLCLGTFFSFFLP